MEEKNNEKSWEEQIDEVESSNHKIIAEFENWLFKKHLTKETIQKHLNNIDFYANGYLTRYEIIPVEDGALDIGSFLGDYFIRKASWSSKYTIKENISSFKKFYTFLHEIKKISKDDLDGMKEIIKEEKDEWIEEVEQYWDEINDDW